MITKFSKHVLIFAFPILVFLVSCKEDSTGPGTQKTYFPTATGSWWIYLNYGIDSAGYKIPETEYYDTSKIVGTQTINGKSAVVMVSHNSMGESDTSYFAFENNKLYTFLDFFSNEFFDFGKSQWILIADFNGTSWSILPDTTLPPVEIPIPDIGNVKLTATISINGSKGSQSNITVKGKSVVSQEILNTVKMIMKFEIPGVPIPLTTTTNVVMHLYFVENIGLVRLHVDPTSINLTIIQQWIDGSHSEIVDYYIAQ
jgi:hypothetical protein